MRVFDQALGSNDISRLYAENRLPGTNAVPIALLVTTNLAVGGCVTVSGEVSFAEGVLFSRPLGDLSCGSFTNAP